jgi:hypothetical protein
MEVHNFRTTSGKDYIFEYLDALPFDEMSEGYEILHGLEVTGIRYFKILKTRKIQAIFGKSNSIDIIECSIF